VRSCRCPRSACACSRADGLRSSVEFERPTWQSGCAGARAAAEVVDRGEGRVEEGGRRCRAHVALAVRAGRDVTRRASVLRHAGSGPSPGRSKVRSHMVVWCVVRAFLCGLAQRVPALRETEICETEILDFGWSPPKGDVTLNSVHN
jgi:hypothetical protein